MVYFKNSFYLTCGTGCSENFIRTFKYCFYKKSWIELTNYNETQPKRGYHGGFIFNSYFFLFSGGLTKGFEPVIKLDLEGENYFWDKVEHLPFLAKENYGLTLIGKVAYIIGGYNYANFLYSNEVQSIDIDSGHMLQLSHAFAGPGKRLKASMVTIKGELLLFGGINGNILYNDLWIFNIANEKWRFQNVSGDVPSPRHSHAANSDGDVMTIFGGEDGLGLNGDLFLYNSLTYTWEKMTGVSVKPRPTKGACIVLEFPTIYIYGGITSTGTTNDFWLYHIAHSLFISTNKNTKMAYMKCYFFNNIFYALGGVDDNGMNSYEYATFNFGTGVWGNIQYNNSFTNGIQVMLNKTYINIGGQMRLQELAKKTVVINDNLTSYTYYNDYPYVYFSAFSYHRDRIYSFGGGYNQGKFPLNSIGTNTFYYIDIKEICLKGICEAKCSKGTYSHNASCVECEPGYYNNVIGNETCYPCPPGTYSTTSGSSSYRQCYPCPSGTFNDVYGSEICLQCPTGFHCPWGSKDPMSTLFNSDLESVQPKMYTSKNSTNNIYIYIISSIAAFITIFIAILTIEIYKKVIFYFDIYTDKHNHELLAPMTLKKNTIGGIFSLFFIIIAIIFIGSAIIDFQMRNIQETKSIIPLALLENEVENFKNPDLTLSLQIIGVGLDCGLTFQFEIININATKQHRNCQYLRNNGIKITYICNDCFISGDATFLLKFVNMGNYASSAIYANITSSSSIPNEVSSFKSELFPEKNYMFMGSEKSEFFFTLTPSLFVSEASYWPSKLTGYHVSSNKLPVKGSQGLISDLPVNAGLNILITIYENQFVLYTQRIRKQSFIILMSGVIGSVFGIMDIIAFIMKFIEGFYLYFQKKIVKTKSLSTIKSQRKHIKNACFGSHFKKENLEEKLENFDDSQSKIENLNLV